MQDRRKNKTDHEAMLVLAVWVAFIWGASRMAVIMGWAHPNNVELATQALTTTDAVMLIIVGYYFGYTAAKNHALQQQQQAMEQRANEMTVTETTTVRKTGEEPRA